MKKITRGRFLILCVAVTLTLSFAFNIALAYSAFPDVPDNASYIEELNALVEAGIFKGDANGNFNPNQPLTRAEGATLLVRLYDEVLWFDMEDKDFSMAQAFNDVPSSHWACDSIRTASAIGLINGYGDGRFGPGDPLTYNQTLALLVRVLLYEGMAGEWGGWPDGYIEAADFLGITKNTESTANAPVPRSTVAVLMYNACFNVGAHDGDPGD